MNIPYIRVLDFKTLTLKTEIDSYKSFRLLRKLRGCGEFELHIPLKVAPGIKIDDIILPGSAGHKACIVRGIEELEEEKTAVITGETLNGLTRQRLVLGTDNPDMLGWDCIPLTAGQTVPAETVIKHYAAPCFTAPGREIQNLVIAPDLGRGPQASWMARYQQLNDVLSEVCQYYEVGYVIRLSPDDKKLYFDIIPSREVNVCFAENYDNISGISVQQSNAEYKNVAYAAGAGQDENRTVLAVTNENDIPTGIDRHETFFDCGDLPLTESDTQISLETEALHRLADCKMLDTVECEALQIGPFFYGRDYDLGDFVTVKTANRMAKKQITEAEEIYEAGNIGVYITFGDPKSTPGEVIKRLVKN